MRHKRKDISHLLPILAQGLVKFLAVITCGIFGGLNDFWQSSKGIGRIVFFRDYIFVALLFAALGVLAFYFLNKGGYFNYFNYEIRRIIFAAFITPALFIHLIGQIKRLCGMNLSPWFAVLNFVPFASFFIIAILLSWKGLSQKKARG